MSSFDVVVIGGGIAGASVAWHAARRGLRPLVVERAQAPGTQATAQNAAMIRGLAGNPALRPLAREGAAFWRALPAELGLEHGFRTTGSLLLASTEESWARLSGEAMTAVLAGGRHELCDAVELRRRFPLLADTPMLGGVLSPGDGVADPAGLCAAFLRGAERRGGRLTCGREVAGLDVVGGRVRGVVLADGERLAAARVVNAAGAWAGALDRGAGLSDHGLVPHRRHLFCSVEVDGTSPDHPFVWHLDHEAYFRPEGGGYLFSACDQDPVEAGPARMADGIEERAAARLGRVFPFLVGLPLRRAWAGLRTFRRGGAFVLGPDAEVEGLHHAAGLGGHGVTCCGPVGRIVAEGLATCAVSSAGG
ncbi:MAG: FAD-dependent oxidoreductase [Planctomycetota bacterium]